MKQGLTTDKTTTFSQHDTADEVHIDDGFVDEELIYRIYEEVEKSCLEIIKESSYKDVQS